VKRYLLPIIVLLFFILEGTIFQIFAPERYGMTYLIIPRFIIVVIIMIGAFYGRVYAVVYGLCFGLLYDVVYTEILGVYMFGMGFLGYICSISYEGKQRNFFPIILTTIAAITLLEYYLFGIFFILNNADMTGKQFFLERLLPTIGLNLVFTLIIIYPMRKVLIYFQKKDDPMSL
jgi:rod shape-determining protein MreD